jgi:hypothetical protein
MATLHVKDAIISVTHKAVVGLYERQSSNYCQGIMHQKFIPKELSNLINSPKALKNMDGQNCYFPLMVRYNLTLLQFYVFLLMNSRQRLKIALQYACCERDCFENVLKLGRNV